MLVSQYISLVYQYIIIDISISDHSSSSLVISPPFRMANINSYIIINHVYSHHKNLTTKEICIDYKHDKLNMLFGLVFELFSFESGSI